MPRPRIKTAALWFSALALGLLPAAVQPAAAQTGSGLQGIGDREIQRQEERERQRQREITDRSPDVHFQTPSEEDPAAYPPDESPCFTIREIRLTGDSAGQFRGHLKAADGAVGLCLGPRGFNAAMTRIQNSLMEAGYVTTRVVAEPQDLTTGILTLTLIPGRLSALKPAGEKRAAVFLPAAFPVSPGDILNLRDLEQGLENLKRVPTAEADIQIVPGENDGESEVLVSWSQRRPVRFTLSLDDSGLEATGRYQGGVTFSLDNAFGFSDLFYFNYNQALKNHAPYGSEGHSFYYSLPWGYWELTAGTSDYSYEQKVAGYQTTYSYRGRSRNSKMELSRLLHRDGLSKTSLALAGFLNSSRNYVDDTELEIQRRMMSGWEAALS
ncbi:MAG: ShlB/FhaC/HecB family hemolysin secretion/activation protein, partial [Candidatus Adiutrix sp.]|nr:ShlB/FhaC/HecB family hemolysin secretion/activation protein [Candidatus Adiutrix sp.]